MSAGWSAALAGRDPEALAAFRSALGRDPGDVWALFGESWLAFERGDSLRATTSSVELLEHLAAGGGGGGGEGAPAVASMAAGRLAILLDEFGGSEAARRALEDRLLAVPQSRLPWEARYGLTMILDHAARRRGDLAMLSRAAQGGGCVRELSVTSPAGILPHLDLDAAVGPAAGAAPAVTAAPASSFRRSRRVQIVGCVAAIPSFDQRAGAQRMFADIDVPFDGAYDLVLDFVGEARLILDGGAAMIHGGEFQYGPRVSGRVVSLSRGRHIVELRLATYGGHPELALLVSPARAAEATVINDGVARAREITTGIAATAATAATAAIAAEPNELVADLAATYVAYRLGDFPDAWRGAERLEKTPRFALGLALAAAIARDDPSRSASFTRDRSRTLLEAAVAVDPELARPRHALATIALDDDRPREAIDQALAANRSAPAWWVPEWTLYSAYRLRGLTWDADQALDRAIAHGAGACPVIETALDRAEDRHDVAAQQQFGAALSACGKDSEQQIERMRRLGDLDGAEAALRRVIALAPERGETKLELAGILLSRGRPAEAVPLLAATVDPRDGEGQLRLADALVAAGAPEQARARIATALAAHPETPEILRAARALALPLPMDAFRLDGQKVIGDFEASGRHYAAPAVVVLDRTVARVFPNGAEVVLNHEIVRVQSKDAIEKWGEISVPEGTEILVLRTHKADGSTREPEELAGKDSISAADLAIGDYVEKETIETRAPREAFITVGSEAGPADLDEPGGGYLSDRFYFQSFDAPLDRSEYLLVTPAAIADRLHFDRRAGAPESNEMSLPPQPPATPAGAGPAQDSKQDSKEDSKAPAAGDSEALTVTTFAATKVPQLFAERSSVPPIEFVPSVRVSTGIGWTTWTRFLREQLYGTLRSAPVLDRAAAEIRAQSPDTSPASRAAALVAWVGHNVEPGDDLRDSASLSVARGRGNRLAVTLALARALGLEAEPVLARSLLTADGQAPAPLEEADDFADPLVRFRLGLGLAGSQVLYADPRLKHAPLGYLPPGLDGARVLMLARGEFEVAHSRREEHRTVDVAVHLNEEGGGTVEVSETLRGWPALEWADIVDRFGSDASKIRQDFEQRWLGVHFPGAVLKDLHIEILGKPGDPRGSPAGVAPPPPPPPEGLVVATAPSGPYAVEQARLRYAFRSARLGLKSGGEIRFLPTFFRSQPGRRYATESRRFTELLTGFDVPMDLQARVELPAGTRLVGAEREITDTHAGSASARASTGASTGALVSGKGGYRFFEERRVGPASGSGTTRSQVLVIRRQSRLPIIRVPLPDYPATAADLRRVDALEQEEVRIGIRPEHP